MMDAQSIKTHRVELDDVFLTTSAFASVYLVEYTGVLTHGKTQNLSR